ncbi:MAG: hypothetical protein ACJ768_02610 [Gaiellaceae bacterium]
MRALREARCISCGCTDSRACQLGDGPCTWILVDRERERGLCSSCATLPQRIYAVIGDQGINTVQEIAFLLTRSASSVQSALIVLAERGLVRRVRGGGRRPARWHLTEAR